MSTYGETNFMKIAKKIKDNEGKSWENAKSEARRRLQRGGNGEITFDGQNGYCGDEKDIYKDKGTETMSENYLSAHMIGSMLNNLTTEISLIRSNIEKVSQMYCE